MKISKKWSFMISLLTIGLLLVSCSSTPTSEQSTGDNGSSSDVGLSDNGELQPVNIRFSGDFPAPPFHGGQMVEHFKKRVEEEIPGSTVTTYYAGALYTGPEAIEALSTGDLEMSAVEMSKTAPVDPWATIVGQPGLLTTLGAIHEFGDMETGKLFFERLESNHNIKPIAYHDMSFFLGVAAQQYIGTPDDFSGLRIRTFGPIQDPVVESWGGSPVVMAFGDVPSALESGVIDAVGTSMGGWQSISDQAPYYIVPGMGGFSFDIVWVGFSLEWWNRLNLATQAKLEELVHEAVELNNVISWCNDITAIEERAASDTSQPGVHVLSPEQSELFLERSRPAVAKWLENELPAEAHEWIYKFREEAEAAVERNPIGSDPLEQVDCSEYEDLIG